MPYRTAFVSVTGLAVLLAACAGPERAREPAPLPAAAVLEASYEAEEAGVQAATAAPEAPVVPAPLEAFNGWEARLLWESEVEVWGVFAADVLPSRAGLEIVAMDERGRANLVFMNNDEPVPWMAVMDGQWLGTAGFGDVDPRRPGPELYVAGARGNVYQVVPLPQGGFESRVVWFARDEVHTLILDEAVPGHPGPDLLACTLEGGIYHLVPSASVTGWDAWLLHQDPGRVRNAVVHDFTPALEGNEVLYVSRSGNFVQLGWKDGELAARTIRRDAQGLARITLGMVAENGVPVVYTAGDDGRIFRCTLSPDGAWNCRVIYAGPAGARGVAAGRFTDDTTQECVAVFGYSMEVVLLVRDAGSEDFEPRTIFRDTDKGHWLIAVDLDGRNGTDELVSCGYSGRVVLLTLD